MTDILQIAACTVGLTEILKNLINKDSKVLKVLMTLGVGILLSLAYMFIPGDYRDKTFICLDGISVAVLAYDVLLKKLMDLSIPNKNDVSNK